MHGRPNDERGFLHKSKFGKFFGGVVGTVAGIVPGVSTALGIGQTALGIGKGLIGGAPPIACPPGFSKTTKGCRPTQTAAGRRARGEPEPMAFRAPPELTLPGDFSGFAPTGPAPCPEGTVPDPKQRGFCVAPSSTFGGRSGVARDFGTAEMGQFGAGLNPAVFLTETRRCPRGAVLGSDGLCYNRRDIANTNRMWPRGRRPLLTGGEMRCISIASSASKKLQRKQKQLQDMGMLPKPSKRGRRALPAGHHAHVAHN